MSRIVYVNGAYLPEEEAKISVFDRGFIFGDGIYEVSAVIGGKLVDCEAHLARLERSCGEIRLGLPWSKAELVAIQDGLADTLPGYQSSWLSGEGHLVVDVVYDDGSLQDWLDSEHGKDVVVLNSLLVDS